MHCRIHLGGIITEGSDSGFLEVKPAPYNVVLEDDTYKGQIKIGFKFIANVRMSIHIIRVIDLAYIIKQIRVLIKQITATKLIAERSACNRDKRTH